MVTRFRVCYPGACVSVLICTPIPDRAAVWRDTLAELLPAETVHLWPDGGDPAAVEFTVTWRHPRGLLSTFPNLKAMLSMGAGVDHLVSDPDLPEGVPVVRLVDPVLENDMTQHVLHWVIRYHRHYHRYPVQQAEARWERLRWPEAASRTVGIMGLGRLGRAAARSLAELGFPVVGWRRTGKAVPGVETLTGARTLTGFLARSQILVCLLPLTAETRGILDARALAALPRGAFLVNPARGGHVVDADLVAALDEGRLERASLDVFNEEPLPPESPLWRHPAIDVTPHVAGWISPRSACRALAATIRAARAGRPLAHVVDRGSGY